MASRALVVAIAAAAAIAVPSSLARQPPTGTAVYVVRNDPRLCPSPLCGGYWVALANGARTRCQDGLRYPRCYVAVAVDRRSRPLGRLPEEALVRGAIDTGRDDLGALVALAAYRPAGTAPSGGGFYRIVDNGTRCVRAPCFSYTVTQVNGRTRGSVSDVDLEAAEAPPAEVARARSALGTRNGLYARGRFAATPDGGTTFRALRLYLRAPLPRA